MLGVGDRPRLLLEQVRGLRLVDLPAGDGVLRLRRHVRDEERGHLDRDGLRQGPPRPGDGCRGAGGRGQLLPDARRRAAVAATVGGPGRCTWPRCSAGPRSGVGVSAHLRRHARVPDGRTGCPGGHPAPAQPGARDGHDPRQAGPRGRRGRGLGGPADGRRGDQGPHLHDLASYLVQLEESLTAHGATVHWARDAAEANAVVAAVAKAHGVDEVVKVKSMATQEIGLNEALAEEGIAAWETDLAELIVQLGDDLPSHILVPAIHRNRAEIRQIFRDRMAACGTARAGRPHRRPGRAGRGGPAAPAGEVPARQGRGVRRELRRGRDRDAGGRRVRGQRPDVPDPARGAGLAWSGSRRWCRPGRTSTCSCGCCRAPRPASG